MFACSVVLILFQVVSSIVIMEDEKKFSVAIVGGGLVSYLHSWNVYRRNSESVRIQSVSMNENRITLLLLINNQIC